MAISGRLRQRFKRGHAKLTASDGADTGGSAAISGDTIVAGTPGRGPLGASYGLR
jgi:hypothetical protein